MFYSFVLGFAFGARAKSVNRGSGDVEKPGFWLFQASVGMVGKRGFALFPISMRAASPLLHVVGWEGDIWIISYCFPPHLMI